MQMSSKMQKTSSSVKTKEVRTPLFQDATIPYWRAGWGSSRFTKFNIVNLGKWVLRYLFASLLDEEIKRDEVYRRTFIESRHSGGLNRPSAPNSIKLPQREFGADDQTTPRANGRMSMATPGFNIGLATPGVALLKKNSNQSAMSPGSGMRSPGLTTPFSAAFDKSADYFSAQPQSSANTPGPNASKQAPTPSETGEKATAETEKAKETPGLFGKKFRMSMAFTGKRLEKKAPEPAKPVVEEKSKEESDAESRPSNAKEEPEFANSFLGTIQQIRHEYSQTTDQNAVFVESLVTPCLPNETPVLNPPMTTTILIQEESHNSAGNTDLFEGRLSDLAQHVDLLEKVAPLWLGDLLLRVSQTSFVNSP